jgi:hypothetical protein
MWSGIFLKVIEMLKKKLLAELCKLLYKYVVRSLLKNAVSKTDNDIDDKILKVIDKYIRSL